MSHDTICNSIIRQCPRSRRTLLVLGGLGSLLGIALIGCAIPMHQAAEAELKRSLDIAIRSEIANVQHQDITLTAPPSKLRDTFSETVLSELRRMAGPDLLDPDTFELGKVTLDGSELRAVRVSLAEAVSAAVTNNFAVQIAGIEPGVTEADVIAAEAVFDAVYFANLDHTQLDQATAEPVISGVAIGVGVNSRSDTRFVTGIRKPLITGGALEVLTSVNRVDNKSPNTTLTPDPSYTTTVEVAINQPLLRGFGSDANLSQIRLRRNTHRTQIENLRRILLDTVNQTEAAYWILVQSRYVLDIQSRLLERGTKTLHRLEGRIIHDADPAQISDGRSRVESRSISVMRSRNNVVISSDRLKQIMNAPGLSVGDEIMVVPTDRMIEEAITFNYLDAVLTAVQHRPEIQQSLLAIDDASIRQMLTDNLRLPRLDVAARVRWNAIDDQLNDSFSSITGDDFVDYIFSLQLEVPIGNRAAEANYRRARLQRMQSVINYDSAVQRVILEVKEALRNVRLNYELLEMTYDSRLAAANSLRTIEDKLEFQAAMTPEFLNVVFTRQEGLAAAELDEVLALIDYQTSLANLYLAMGMGLTRNQIEFVVPDH